MRSLIQFVFLYQEVKSVTVDQTQIKANKRSQSIACAYRDLEQLSALGKGRKEGDGDGGGGGGGGIKKSSQINKTASCHRYGDLGNGESVPHL